MEYEDEFVEVIDEGKIVKVPADYARREGLLVLRKPKAMQLQRATANLSPDKIKHLAEEDKKNPLDVLKKSPDWKQKQVLSELVNNFAWLIKLERRKKGLTRTQLARLINEPENNLKMLEFGILPTPDFQLINKVQNVLGINLRKDGKDFSKIENVLAQNTKEEKKPKNFKQLPKISGNDIELLEDEI